MSFPKTLKTPSSITSHENERCRSFCQVGGGAASALSFLLAVLIIVSFFVPSVSSKYYHNATEVMVNVNGTDRDLQYVFDNNFFNSDLRDRKGLVFSDPSTIHHGKHQASEILVSSDGKTGTLLSYLKNKTLPSGFSRDYSIPTHPATMVFFSSGKSLQELVDVGDFSCTAGWYCDGNYQVGIHADCSTSRYYCSHGCSGGGCNSAPLPLEPDRIINGRCNNSVVNGCSRGDLNDTDDSTAYHEWQCLGRNGGFSVNCYKRGSPVNGSCDNSTVKGCSSGTPWGYSEINSRFPDYSTWWCEGIFGGSNAWCFKKRCSPISGVCDTSQANRCRSGTLRDVADDDNYNYWYCDGICGGSNAWCYIDKPSCYGHEDYTCEYGSVINIGYGNPNTVLWGCHNGEVCVACFRGVGCNFWPFQTGTCDASESCSPP